MEDSPTISTSPPKYTNMYLLKLLKQKNAYEYEYDLAKINLATFDIIRGHAQTIEKIEDEIELVKRAIEIDYIIENESTHIEKSECIDWRNKRLDEIKSKDVQLQTIKINETMKIVEELKLQTTREKNKKLEDVNATVLDEPIQIQISVSEINETISAAKTDEIIEMDEPIKIINYNYIRKEPYHFFECDIENNNLYIEPRPTQFYQDYCSICCILPLLCCCCSTYFQDFSLYKFILYLFTTNLFSNETDELSITEQIAIVFGILFEIYKTMIGSFLIVFTTQRCGNQVCTLIQNFIPKDQLELVAISMNFLQAASLIAEYCYELYREFHLRQVYYNDNRLPHNPNFLDMVENIKECTNDVLINRIYKLISLCVFAVYMVNVMVSAAVIYKNYYDNTSLINFATNVLFIIFKITNVLKITSSKNQTISAYIQQNIVYNRVKKQYIKPLYSEFFDNTSKDYIEFFKNSKDNAYNSILLSPTRYLIKNSNFMEVLFEKPVNSIEQKKDKYCDNSYPYLDTYVEYLKREKQYERVIAIAEETV